MTSGPTDHVPGHDHADPRGRPIREVGEAKGPKVAADPVEVNVRVLAPTVAAITDVTALVGPDLVPQHCHIYIRDGVIAAILPVTPGTPAVAVAPEPRGPEIDATIPRVISGEGMFAMPGMVDVHDRLGVLVPGLPPERALLGRDQHELAVLMGASSASRAG